MTSAEQPAPGPDAAAPWARSATALIADLASGALSAAEAVEAHIARIEAVDRALNAVVWRRFDAARAEAAEADRRRRAGEPLGPLHGLPITIKECFDLAGSPATFGVVSRKADAAAADDRYVAALRRAGAIVLGKTNVSQLLLYIESDNPLYGMTRNPWDLERTPGGSSGGQAAIVAAGGSPLGLGNDIGGSVRLPAAFCGIVGFKPTADRMPDHGRGSMSLGQQAIRSQVGVHGRRVADVALGMRIASGGDAPFDGLAPLGDPGAIDVAGLRIGWYADDELFPPSPAVRRAVREAAEALAHRGARVTAWRPPDLAHAEALFFGLLGADRFELARTILGRSPRDPRIKLLEGAARQPRALVELLLTATGRRRVRTVARNFGPYDTATYWRRVEALLDYRARVLAALGELDAVLSPPAPLPALRHGAAAEVSIMGTYMCIYNLLGWPAGAVPWTRVRADEESDRPASKDPCFVAARQTEAGAAGLPIGVQVAARPWHDHVALAVMAALEREADARPDAPRTPIAPGG
ncbi:MAG TPA: amidase family protein [Kofleriaceae bacterium]|nr:amidase family protein [Kofleriaceae bacterium]